MAHPRGGAKAEPASNSGLRQWQSAPLTAVLRSASIGGVTGGDKSRLPVIQDLHFPRNQLANATVARLQVAQIRSLLPAPNTALDLKAIVCSVRRLRAQMPP